jgi:glyoxylase I family protein
MSGIGEKDDAVTAHLRACEMALLDPAVRRDRARVKTLLADDYEEFGVSGQIWTRDQILDLLTTEHYHAPTMEDFQCARIAGDVALVTYRTARTDPRSGESVSALRSSIWTQKSGEWRIRFHQGTKAL